MMSNIDAKQLISLQRLLEHYDSGMITEYEFCVDALLAADNEREQDLETFIGRIPPELFEGFERRVFDYPLDEPRVTVGVGIPDSPRRETVLRLREILGKPSVDRA
jgi:hypothetical protein